MFELLSLDDAFGSGACLSCWYARVLSLAWLEFEKSTGLPQCFLLKLESPS